MNQKIYNEKLKLALLPSPFACLATPGLTNSPMASRYVSNLSLAPGVVQLVSKTGKLVEGSVKSASDFSYSAPTYAGNRYRIIGDAGG